MLTLVLALAILSGVCFVIFQNRSRQQGPLPVQLPPVVNTNMDDILRALEVELRKYNPDIDQALRPGITPDALHKAETEIGAGFHPEMQQLYRWHNGVADGVELFPGHAFWSLEEAIQTNQQLRQAYRQSGMSDVMAQEESWLSLFPDVAGDGYYYDPQRTYETGGIFYNFRETGYFIVFPSIKNLLMALVECYRAGVYQRDAAPNFELQQQIMLRYGAEFEAP